jgi:hypothetical protein
VSNIHFKLPDVTNGVLVTDVEAFFGTFLPQCQSSKPAIIVVVLKQRLQRERSEIDGRELWHLVSKKMILTRERYSST